MRFFESPWDVAGAVTLALTRGFVRWRGWHAPFEGSPDDRKGSRLYPKALLVDGMADENIGTAYSIKTTGGRNYLLGHICICSSDVWYLTALFAPSIDRGMPKIQNQNWPVKSWFKRLKMKSFIAPFNRRKN